ncbi:hypothetical protein M885DRAFT_626329 [Pelagophyceae sp. CCMP2097]|nr:hypothetical protein M885DRAFT_626329 [Pelagophyceae sp. CCMP2097]
MAAHGPLVSTTLPNSFPRSRTSGLLDAFGPDAARPVGMAASEAGDDGCGGDGGQVRGPRFVYVDTSNEPRDDNEADRMYAAALDRAKDVFPHLFGAECAAAPADAAAAADGALSGAEACLSVADLWFNVGNVRSRLGAVQTSDGAWVTRHGARCSGGAADAWARCLALAPAHLEARNNLAIALMRNGAFLEAIAELSAGLTLGELGTAGAAEAPRLRGASAGDRLRAKLATNLGIAMEHVGRRADAIAAYHSAIALSDRQDDEPLTNLGTALLAWHAERRDAETEGAAPDGGPAPDTDSAAGDSAAGDLLERAVSALHEAKALNDNDGTVCFNLANAFEEQGRLDAAVAEYGRCLDILPTMAAAHNNLALVLEQRWFGDDDDDGGDDGGGDDEDGGAASMLLEEQAAASARIQRHFVAALALDGADYDARCNLGAFLWRRGDAAGALAAYAAAAAARPHEADALLALAELHGAAGRLGDALQHAKAAVRAAADGDDGRARALLRQLLTLWRDFGDDPPAAAQPEATGNPGEKNT